VRRYEEVLQLRSFRRALQDAELDGDPAAVFFAADDDRSLGLTFAEFARGLRSVARRGAAGLFPSSEPQARALFRALDVDGEGLVRWAGIEALLGGGRPRDDGVASVRGGRVRSGRASAPSPRRGRGCRPGRAGTRGARRPAGSRMPDCPRPATGRLPRTRLPRTRLCPRPRPRLSRARGGQGQPP
jgi:hypothetical protein